MACRPESQVFGLQMLLLDQTHLVIVICVAGSCIHIYSGVFQLLLVTFRLTVLRSTLQLLLLSDPKPQVVIELERQEA